MDAFADLENPPYSVQAAVQNSWLPTYIQQTVRERLTLYEVIRRTKRTSFFARRKKWQPTIATISWFGCLIIVRRPELRHFVLE